MRVLDTTPKQDGFYMPAEFSEHYGCILIFPERSDSWQYGAYAARKAFVKVCEAIAQSEKVTVCASDRQYENARRMLPPHIRVAEMSSNDSWARDYAPTFVTNGQIIRGVNWSFNAWGGLEDGLYFPWDKDDRMARKLCDLYDKSMYDASGFVLEGGSIHSDGEGTILATEACLLSRGRNPELSRAEIEQELKNYLGAQKIVWLPRGIYNDETNEHVDNVCAFTSPGHVVLAWTDDMDDPQYQMSSADLEILENETDARGRKIEVHKVYIPKNPVCITEYELSGFTFEEGEDEREAGERLAASYVNFYITNGGVLIPQFGDVMDEPALKAIGSLFEGRKVYPIYARDIIVGGGNIHCITQQIPQ